jgi:hypothetical protein
MYNYVKNNLIKELDYDLYNNNKILTNFEMKNNFPCNYGNKWTEEERKILLKLLNEGNEIEEIALELNRSTGGIKAEIRKIVFNKYMQGIDIEIISKELNIIYKNIKSIIKFYLDKNCDNEIYTLEKENKLLKLKIENIKLKNELKEFI